MDLLELAKAHIEAENQRNLTATMETVADGGAYYHIHGTGRVFTSREDISDFYGEAYEAVPDMHIEIRNAVVDETRRQIFVEYTFTGTNSGTLEGLAPTNKPVRYEGAILYEFDEASKLTKEVTYFDKTEALTSMGLIRNPNTKLGMFLLLFPQSPFFMLKTIIYNLFKKKKKAADAKSKAAHA
ncbi:MAG TPA: nuclear transport factor 2 family protein [Blastocatellia bacterium]|nr:nuclear transport factor 2 family protein [Blastocatellia bacterium]